MNEMAHRLARDQVGFLEKEVDRMSERLLTARRAMVDFQNAKGFISPQAAAESLGTIVARLEGQLTELKAKREAMLGYLSPSAPDIALIDLEIGAIVKQLRTEQGRLTSPKGGTLNRTVEEFQRLEMETIFAQDVYKTALVTLEKGRMEATRNLKKVSIVQSPTLPQYPLEPRGSIQHCRLHALRLDVGRYSATARRHRPRPPGLNHDPAAAFAQLRTDRQMPRASELEACASWGVAGMRAICFCWTRGARCQQRFEKCCAGNRRLTRPSSFGNPCRAPPVF
ncbi:MAG: hypothetical protein IPL11_11680 [Candidatus Accumulibacter sp.]|nr:hypothetical protein [Accumulibacter sp.]